MLLGEPPRTQFDLNFSLLGVPVRVHPLFWLVTVLLGGNLSDAGSVLSWIIAVFLSILVHEFGHALAMRAFGFRPWIILYGMGGLTSYDQGYGGRRTGLKPLGQILISFAGPLAGFLLAGVLVLGLAVAGYGDVIRWVGPWHSKILPQLEWFPNLRAGNLINSIFFISVIWGIVNLLPVYPLDGGQIAREVLMSFNPREGIRWSLMLSMFAAVAMAMIGFTQLHSFYVALFFGYLAFGSYTTLQAYSGRGPW